MNRSLAGKGDLAPLYVGVSISGIGVVFAFTSGVGDELNSTPARLDTQPQ